MNFDGNYIVIDIESDGLVPGLNSMLSIGAVTLRKYTISDFFYAKLWSLPDACPNPNTIKWWEETSPEQWEHLGHPAGKCGPKAAMLKFETWLAKQAEIHGKVISCAWKPHVDVAFIRYYANRFLSHELFEKDCSGLDIKTMTAIAMGKPFHEVSLSKVPLEWLRGNSITHNALDDAMAEAAIMRCALDRIGMESKNFSAME